jgi:thioredoxin reductase
MTDSPAEDARGAGYDVVVVGGGAAGLNAALLLARARRRVAVVDDGHPRNASAAHMHGFLSREGTAPADLLAAGRAEVAGYGTDLLEDRAVRAEREGDNFLIQLAGGPTVAARRLVVATGLRDGLPDIPGVRERWGRDLLHCPYCHGWEVRDQPLGVLGTHPGAVHHALLIRQWSQDLTYFPHTRPTTEPEREQLAALGIRVAEGAVERLVVTDDRLQGVALAGGETVPSSAVFLFPHMAPLDELLTGLGCPQDERGWVTTDGTGRTGVPGVWAVGNVADPRAQVVTAAGMGAAAAFAINVDLVQEDVALAVNGVAGSIT